MKKKIILKRHCFFYACVCFVRREIEKLKGQVKSAREENRQEVSVLTQHNITLSKALKALRDQEEGFMGTKGERAKLSEELHAALQVTKKL